MAFRRNSDAQNFVADAEADDYAGGTLEIRSGSQQSAPVGAATGTLLVSITLPDPAFDAATGGEKAKSGTWQATAATSGTAGHARFVSSGGRVFECTVGGQGSGADIELTNNIDGTDDTEIVAGNPVTITSFTFTAPAE